MKRALRVTIAFVVATMLVGGGIAGTAAAADTNSITDNDLVDLNVNAGNPTIATAVNAANFGSGSSATANAIAEQHAGDIFTEYND